MSKWVPPECQCPDEWRHAEAEWKRGYHEAHRKAWEAGYRKGEKVKRALRKYARGGAVGDLEKIVRKSGNG